MVTAEIFPSRIEIYPYEPGDDSYFEKKMSVFSKVTYSNEFSAFCYDEENQKLIVPRNVSSKITNSRFFNNLNIIDRTNYYDSSRQVEYNCINQPRNAIQAEAIDFLMGGNKYSDYTFMENESEKMLCLATGMGKTYSVIAYLALAKKIGMIIVDQDHIMEQWYKEFLTHTDINEEDIFLISGVDTIKALLKAEGDLPFKVYIASHRTLGALAKRRNGFALLNALFNKLEIAVKIFDEAHVEWKNIILLNSYVDTKETIYLTATPNRSKPEEDTVYQYVFGDIPKYGYERRYDDDEKYQDLVYIEYNTNPSIEDTVSMKNKHGFNMKAYSDYIQENHMDYIFDIISDILDNHPNSKTAIIAHKNEFVKEIAERLKAKYGDSRSVGTFCGLVKNKEARSLEKEKDVVISTDRSLNKAVNILGLEVVISLNQYSSKVVSYQTAGRLRKEEGKPCTFYDFTDMGFAECVKQRKYRKSGLEIKSKSKTTKKY